ncbi:hypothetical protein FisN_24Hh167 [Fistulifera solaris]|uniref:Sulfotransferase domain-containing protein n=1 Tax=Fistulifera solaris TaxID=1519565 RepID=A0A1Z5JV76_FISSO|nr:hypothetical protein FisN_24Hh167 [Fistulifera solaris]|eukprot:GAX17766.1 hypothetical protein FisN_24Hh167 [Fistulifera solaris]
MQSPKSKKSPQSNTALVIHLARALGLLFLLSAILNLFYHSHLPTPSKNWEEQPVSPPKHNKKKRIKEQSNLKSKKIHSPFNPLDIPADIEKHSVPDLPSDPDDEDEKPAKQHNNHGAVIKDTLPEKVQPTAAPTALPPPAKHGTVLPPKRSSILQKNIPQLWTLVAEQVVKTDKDGKPLHHNIHNVTASDLQGIGQDVANITMEEARKGREPLLELLTEAGVTSMDAVSVAKLPTWQQVTDLYGDGPVIYGLETCQQFRDKVPPEDASIGTAGLFNTGTNPFAMYLSANCEMPQNTNDKAKGMRWQVPWGKHMLATYKWRNTAKHDYHVNKTNVLPTVLIRDPYSWMQSMCRHPYGARFVHDHIHCPGLVPSEHDRERHPKELKDKETIPVVVTYPGRRAHFDSLAHFWAQWYREYLEADYPRLIIRFEDMIFHPRKVLSLVCECAGAKPKQEAFSYVVGEGKWGNKVHEGSSNMISAMIRYGSNSSRLTQMSEADLELAYRALDPELMDLFQYPRVPPVGS